MFLKTFNTAFDEIIITLRNKNRRALETEDKPNLEMLINKQK